MKIRKYSTLCAGLTTSLSTDCKTYTLLTSVHNDADAPDDVDNANNYNRVSGIALLKAFSCGNNENDTMTEIIREL